MRGAMCSRLIQLGLLIACSAPALHTVNAADFIGANVGAIPDVNPAGRDVTFAVSGFSGAIGDVSLSMTIGHTFVNDLEVVLIAPSGVARRTVFWRTGSSATGGSADLSGTYVFNDRAPNDLWLAAAVNPLGIILQGVYRTSTEGGVNNDAVKTGGCPTPLTFAFSGLSPAQINGTWTLHVADVVTGDSGSISAAKLSLLDPGDILFGNSFESVAYGSCVRAQFDYTGSNRSSYVLVRNTGGGSNGAMTWFIRDNDGTTTGFERSYQLGIATDSLVGGDFDGDGRWDPAVWSPGTPGHYKVLLSSRPGDPPFEFDYGQTGDDPTHAGDYDGDGKTDFAHYRPGASAGAASSTVIHLSSNGSDRVLTTGVNGNTASGGSDISGDGIADIAIKSSAGSGNAKFDIYSGANGALSDTFNFGKLTDVVVSGSHSGSAVADITVVRKSSGVLLWNTRESGTGTAQPQVTFGVTTDFPLSGDFDGDGIDDYAVWRPNPNPALTIFSILPSSDPTTPFDVNFGMNGDRPVENTRTH